MLSSRKHGPKTPQLLLPILPPPPPTRATSSPRAETQARVDGCPECIANTEPPLLEHPIEDGFVAFYRCSDCGHLWSTAWGDR